MKRIYKCQRNAWRKWTVSEQLTQHPSHQEMKPNNSWRWVFNHSHCTGGCLEEPGEEVQQLPCAAGREEERTWNGGKEPFTWHALSYWKGSPATVVLPTTASQSRMLLLMGSQTVLGARWEWKLEWKLLCKLRIISFLLAKVQIFLWNFSPSPFTKMVGRWSVAPWPPTGRRTEGPFCSKGKKGHKKGLKRSRKTTVKTPESNSLVSYSLEPQTKERRQFHGTLITWKQGYFFSILIAYGMDLPMETTRTISLILPFLIF